MDPAAAYGDLYSDPYYDLNDTVFNNSVIRDYGTMTTFFRGSCALMLRVAFLLIQLGCIPSTNVNLIILQNIVDIASATISYATIGYMFSFGYDAYGVFGIGGWIVDDNVDIDNAILGWSGVIVATGIYTTMFAGRMHFIAYFFFSILIGGVVLPIIMHWVWASPGWMHSATFMTHHVSYKDQGGGMIIHVCGGTAAFIGILFFGRRLIRLNDIDESSITAESPTGVIVGYILLIIGLSGICLPSPTYEFTHLPDNYIGIVIINNILAAAGGIFAVAIVQLIIFRDFVDYWLILRCVQGAVAGIVTVASGIDVYKPLVALGLSIPGALLFYIIAYNLFYSSLEDYTNIIPIHLSCGFLGTLLPPLCGTREGFGVSHRILVHFGWQIVCDLIIISSFFIIVGIFFTIITLIGLLRNRSEERNHRRAMIASSRGPPRHYFQRLFKAGKNSPLLRPGYRPKRQNIPNIDLQ